MPKYSNQFGLAPLAVLIAVGVVIFAGGSYIINKKYVSFSKLNTVKVEQDTKESQKASLPKQELSKDSFTSKPASQPSSGERELGFTITPPSGWVNKPSDKYDRARFVSPSQDTEKLNKKTGDSIYSQPAQVAVSVFILGKNEEGKFEDDEAGMKKLFVYMMENDKGENHEVVEQQYIRRDYDYPGLQYEFKSTLTNGSHHRSYGYLIKYGKYVVMVMGISLEFAWDQNSGILKHSVDSFKITF